jgi:protocatechuate 3,4-dioxygenase beta subunit
MPNDDSNSARLLTRREAIRVLGAGAASLFTLRTSSVLAAQQESGTMCVVRPRHIEGPFFVDRALNRSDIRSDPRTGTVSPGMPVRLTFRVSQLGEGRCVPLGNAQVDVWQCDADGLYSDTSDWQASTVGQRFLRGYQLTDKKGIATFTTIYPGWYPNRTVHIHFKIRTEPRASTGREFTSQIYFEDDLTDLIHAQPAYADHGSRKVRNNRDLLFLFRGSRLLLPLREEKRGYAGTFDIALDV